MLDYNDQVRRVIAIAHEEARVRSHESVGTEHLLLGLSLGEGRAARTLERHDISADTIRAEVEKATTPERDPRTATPPVLSPGARRALADSRPTARHLGSEQVGTEHVLLALTLDDSRAAEILTTLGADVARLRQEIAPRLPSPVPADREQSPGLGADDDELL